jgi:DNA helicase-2/ATP-dependent DNA helicase PcrA
MARVYEKYQRLLKANNAVDFDDLLMKLADLLRHNAEVRTACQQRYQYVLIDEYQDTNHAQFMIAHTLSAGHRNICVVGDPDQSIYGWRGANIRNILEFEQHFPDAKVVALGQNWRSTPEILAAADALIRNNRQRRHKPLFTDNAGGSAIAVVHAADEEHEAELVVEYLRAQQSDGLTWSDMAVFYRVNALSRALEDRLMRSSIPYQVARGTAFYDRKEVKDAIAYLKMLANPADQVALERIINTPTRGIGKTSLDHLKAFAAANDLTLWDALGDPRILGQLPARTAKAVGKFSALFDQWREQLTGDSDNHMFAGKQLAGVRQLVESVITDSGLEAMYRKQDEEKLANLDELITAAQRFDEEYGEPEAALSAKVNDYLQAVALVSDVDAVDEESGAVTLMTLHAAKGLEFGAVAMVGLEEGLLPHSRSLDDPSEMEEERRLCFVGITRACRHLMLSHARYRAIRGYRERTIPSQFINELPQEVIEVRDVTSDRDFADDAKPGYGARPSRVGLPTGSLVRHPQFGVGTVEQVSGAGASTRARVKFPAVGIKTLILQYARLERVE